MHRNERIYVDKPGDEVDVLLGCRWDMTGWPPGSTTKALEVYAWRTVDGVKREVVVATYPPDRWRGVQMAANVR